MRECAAGRWTTDDGRRTRYEAMGKKYFLVLLIVFSSLIPHPSSLVAQEGLLIDDFEKQGNCIGGRSNTYEKEPSRALALRSDKEHCGDTGRSLMLRFDKKGDGGPYGRGGWCGYYTQLRSGSRYFDASGYKNISFQVKGASGNENFKIGLADKRWEELGDSIKSKDIKAYLPKGGVTQEWQKATVPLNEFFLDHKELSSVAICFENECFPPAGAAKGTIYIDDFKLE